MRWLAYNTAKVPTVNNSKQTCCWNYNENNNYSIKIDIADIVIFLLLRRAMAPAVNAIAHFASTE